MSKRLALALAVSLVAVGSAHAEPKSPAWIERSNTDAKVLLDVMAKFNPEFASQVGVLGFDDKVADLKPDVDARSRAAFVDAKGKLEKMLADEKDENVRQDLQIMIKAVDQQIEGIDLNHKYMLPYQDVGQLIFQGEFVLLKDEVAANRRAAAVKRLECYVGKAPGCTPIIDLAKAQTNARIGEKDLIGPYKNEVEQKLSNTPRYAEGIRQLFAKYKLDNAEGKAALDAMDSQLKDYDGWVRSTIVPRARRISACRNRCTRTTSSRSASTFRRNS